MNLTILKGNLGKDPEIKTFDWGKVASFSLATTEKYKNKAGELITETDWHTCIFRGPVCDAIEKYLHKGDQVIVTGKTKYRSYDKDGAKIYITEIRCSEFEFTGSKPEASQEQNKPSGGKQDVKSMSNADDLPQHIKDAETASDNMDDLPY